MNLNWKFICCREHERLVICCVRQEALYFARPGVLGGHGTCVIIPLLYHSTNHGCWSGTGQCWGLHVSKIQTIQYKLELWWGKEHQCFYPPNFEHIFFYWSTVLFIFLCQDSVRLPRWRSWGWADGGGGPRDHADGTDARNIPSWSLPEESTHDHGWPHQPTTERTVLPVYEVNNNSFSSVKVVDVWQYSCHSSKTSIKW